MAPTFGLSIHRDFACRHSGACCTAGWPIHAEPATVDAVTSAVARRAFTIGGATPPARLFEAAAAPAGEAGVEIARRSGGSCVFFEPEADRLCAIQRHLGHAALPLACRQFPRVTLTDARGTFVTLTHYCPTAAQMLFRPDVALAVERDPPAFPPGSCDGLDARRTLPPLLRPGMLHSLDSYAAWERFQVDTLADERHSAESALAAIADCAEAVRQWSPGTGSLEGHLARAIARAVAPSTADALAAPLPDAPALAREVWACYPPPLAGPGPVDDFEGSWTRLAAEAWPALARPVRRYLAARAFGSWIAYQGAGIRTAVNASRTALALLQVECVRRCQAGGRALDAEVLLEAVRAADLALVHLAAPDLLTRRLARFEAAPL